MDEQVETKCKTVLRSISGYDWGVDKHPLLDIYRSLKQSCMDYICLWSSSNEHL